MSTEARAYPRPLPNSEWLGKLTEEILLTRSPRLPGISPANPPRAEDSPDDTTVRWLNHCRDSCRPVISDGVRSQFDHALVRHFELHFTQWLAVIIGDQFIVIPKPQRIGECRLDEFLDAVPCRLLVFRADRQLDGARQRNPHFEEAHCPLSSGCFG
jgi:hypothetical protein